MYKDLFKDFDKIKAPEGVVTKVVDYVVYNNENRRIPELKECNKRRRIVPLLAACLVLVFVCTLVMGLCTDFLSAKSSRRSGAGGAQMNYGFIIRANSQKSDGDAVIGIYSGTATGGWAMYQNLEKYGDASPNFFQSYGFSMLDIEGKGIESVTFKTEAEGVYFAISPAGYYLITDEETAARMNREQSENYSEISLRNSQYTAEELVKYSDGISYGNIYCDTFKYTNDSATEKISFSNKLELVIESNHNNKEVSDKLDRVWQCEQELLEIRAHHTAESGVLTDREEELYQEIDVISQDIRRLVLSDATMEVLVEFEDGTKQNKILKLGFEIIEGQGMRLTISE